MLTAEVFNAWAERDEIAADILEGAAHGLADPDTRYRTRQAESVPLLKKFRAWLDEALSHVAPKGALGEALQYLHKYWPKLIRYCEDGRLPLDNNRLENAIRPFVIGRKAWLFSDTPAGAHASAALYSLIETAKASRSAVGTFYDALPWTYVIARRR